MNINYNRTDIVKEDKRIIKSYSKKDKGKG